MQNHSDGKSPHSEDDDIADIIGLIRSTTTNDKSAVRKLLSWMQPEGLYIPFWESSPDHVRSIITKYIVEIYENDDIQISGKDDIKSISRELLFCLDEISQIQKISKGKQLIVWSAIRAAFELGIMFNAPEKIKEKLRLERSTRGSKGGVQSGKRRREKSQNGWHNSTLASAREMRTKNPTLSQDDLASNIIEKANSDGHLPKHVTIKKQIAKWEKSGELQKRTKK